MTNDYEIEINKEVEFINVLDKLCRDNHVTLSESEFKGILLLYSTFKNNQSVFLQLLINVLKNYGINNYYYDGITPLNVDILRKLIYRYVIEEVEYPKTLLR